MRKFREPTVLAEWNRLLQLSLAGSAESNNIGPRADGQDMMSTENHLDRSDDAKHAAATASDPRSPNGLAMELQGSDLCNSAGGTIMMAPGTGDGVNTSPAADRGLGAAEHDAAAAESNQEQPGCPTDGVSISQEVDPFQALKYAEILATHIAQALAPRRIRRPGEVRRAFGFAGHRWIFREVYLL